MKVHSILSGTVTNQIKWEKRDNIISSPILSITKQVLGRELTYPLLAIRGFALQRSQQCHQLLTHRVRRQCVGGKGIKSFDIQNVQFEMCGHGIH